MNARSMVRAFAVALAVFVVPGMAMAAGPEGRAEKVQRGDRGDHEKAFPMKGADFIAKVEARIQKVRSRVQERIAKMPLTDAQKKQVMAEVDAGSAKVKVAAQKAAADGTVTKEEGKQVRDLAKEVKRELRAKAGLPEEGRRDHKKGRGKNKA